MMDFELQAEHDARWGDPLTCPRHGVAISSPDGLVGGECPECEMLSEFVREQEEHYIEEEGRTGLSEDESPF